MYRSRTRGNQPVAKPVTAATDVFALGLIAAVVVTGRHPYGDGAGISIAAQIANTAQQPPDLSGYPDELRPSLERCLTADPERRPTPAEPTELCRRAASRELRDFAGRLPRMTFARTVSSPRATGCAWSRPAAISR
ncbi:protein kinase [Streptomyces sp. NPDC007983]|uniref:protein kinase n=1 Tax=Streptomyces sp. NPDC007983 TaxID=3364800 RepID=UPI0036E48C11